METYDLGIFTADAWRMSPEQEAKYLDRRLQPHFDARRPTAPIGDVVQVVSYCGTENQADQPKPVIPVAAAIALRIS